MAKTSLGQAKANRSAKVSLAITGASQGRHRATARLVYPLPVAPDTSEGIEEVDMDDLLDEYQACAA
jgi:hypothetical protein